MTVAHPPELRTGSAMPRLCRGLAVLPSRRGLIVEGGPRRQLFSGSGADVLHRLMPLLDGKHDTPALCAEVGLDERRLLQALSLLKESGLLESGDPGTHRVPGAPEFVLDYFSRMITTTGGYGCAEALAAALEEAYVLVVAEEAVAEQVSTDLAETGVGTVRICPPGGRVATHIKMAQAAPRRVAVVFDDPASPGILPGIVASCQSARVPVLRLASTRSHVEIGPVFYPEYSACVRCFRRGYESAAWQGKDAAAVSPAETVPAAAAGLLAAHATHEVLALVAQTWPASSAWTLTRVGAAGWSAERFDVFPEPGCAKCGGPAAEHPVASMIEAFEWQMEGPPEAFDWSGVTGRAEADRLRRLQDERPAFPGAPRRALPGPGAEGAVACGGQLNRLAALLQRTAGLRHPADPGRSAARWAPSGGNLASAELYVLAANGICGLPGTIFRYDDIGHAIIAVRSDQVPFERCLATTDAESATSDFVIVFVTSVRRLARKYGSFAWRLGHLDAGCAATQLAAVSADYGFSVHYASRWGEELSRILELDRPWEVITAVAAITSGG